MFKLLKFAAFPNVCIESVSVTPYLDRYTRYLSQFTLELTFRDTSFRDVTENEDLLSQPLSRYGVSRSSVNTHLLRNLKSPETVKLCLPTDDGDVTAVSVRNNLDVNNSALFHGTIFVRSFYGRLAKQLISKNWSILLGNPGVSKSWFQWYLLYCIANKCGCYDSTESPKVIVRQVASNLMTYYFPLSEEAYESRTDPFLLRQLDQRATLYLYEPGSRLSGPFHDTYSGQIIATCSPDERRYKEFQKNGAIKFYMPCWTLDELQAVGAYIDSKCHEKLEVDFSPMAVSDRFKRFGGIFRYVLPHSKLGLLQAERNQLAVLTDTSLSDAYARYTSIEKTDDRKTNISHFVLQYNVQYGHQHGKEEFTSFTMQVASAYVKDNFIFNKMNDNQMVQCVEHLNQMFTGSKAHNPELFQLVVYNVLGSSHFEWQIFENGKWIDHKWNVQHREKIVKGDESVANMKPNVLYYPEDELFPGVDFIFVKNSQADLKVKQAFAIQVTFSNAHKKKASVYQSLYKRLEMNPNTDKITIYVITKPANVKGYTVDTGKKLCTNFKETIGDMPKLCFVVVKSDWQIKLRTII